MPEQRPRRAEGTGSISPRKDGRFDAAITLQTLLEKRRLKTVVATYRDGERWITKMRRDYEQTGLSADGRNLTVAAYYPLWLASIEGSVVPKTHREYADKFRPHTAPRHGTIRLPDLTTPHVNALYKDMLASGASPRLIGSVHAAYRKALSDAEGWDLVRKTSPASPAAPGRARPPGHGTRRRIPLPRGDLRRPSGGALPVGRRDRPPPPGAARDQVGGPRQGRATGPGHEDEEVQSAGRAARPCGGRPTPPPSSSC